MSGHSRAAARLSRRRLPAAVAVLVCSTASTPWVHAQDYPTRPITMVVPFGTGNIADNQGRWAARHLAGVLGQPVVVENKPGASGMIGAEHVARAAPDGYTLMYGTHGTQAANLALRPKSAIDPAKELVGVHSLFRQSTVLVVRASAPWQGVQDLVRAAREKPGVISYASSGVGTQTHLAAVRFQDAAGVSLNHVPYSGPSALPDVIAGNVDITFSYAESVVQHIQSGRLRALAINGQTRMAVLPDVPTVAEAGLPDAALEGWSGVFAPKGTPAAILRKLSAAIAQGTESAEVKADMARIGSYPMGLDADHFQAFVEKEVPRWRQIVQSAGAVEK